MTEAKTLTIVTFLACGRMLLQRVAIVAKKLPLDDKIAACVKEICLLGVVCKVLNRKTLSVETFCFPEKTCAINIEFCALNNLLFFYELLYVLLFSCNPIGQLCLSGTGYGSRTVSIDYSCFFSLINVCRLAFR